MAAGLPAGFLDAPLIPPPPGTISNFQNPPSRVGMVNIVSSVCIPLILSFAILRFYAKLRVLRKKSKDDLMYAISTLAGLSYICVTIASTDGNMLGRHGYDMRVGQFTSEKLLVLLIQHCMYGPCIWLVKLSLFVLYLETFGRLRWLRYSAYLGMTITGILYFTATIAIIMLYGPKHGHSAHSYLEGEGAHRALRVPLLMTVAVINVVSDVYLVILPLPAVWALHLPLRRKIGVAAMILTGIFACIVALIGLILRPSYGFKDGTWSTIPVVLTSIVEMTAGLMVCCMPTMVVALKSLSASISSPIIGYTRKALSSGSSHPSSEDHAQSLTDANIPPTKARYGYETTVSTLISPETEIGYAVGSPYQYGKPYDSKEREHMDTVHSIRKVTDVYIV